MREYRPQRSAVLSVGAVFLIVFGLGVFVLVGLLTMMKAPNDHVSLWIFGPIELLLLSGTAGVGWFLLNSLATYRIEPSGMTRIALGKQRQLLWRDVVAYQPTRSVHTGTTWTLTDTAGHKMKVPIHMLERGYGLEGFFEAYAASIQKPQDSPSPPVPQVYRYGKFLGSFMLFGALFLLCMAVGSILASRAQPGPGWGVILPMSLLVFGGFGLLSLGTALYYFTYAIRITPDAITESTLFSTKTLRFDEVAAFYSGAMPMSNGQIRNVTEVVGKNGKKIQANVQLVNYDALTAALRAVMNPTVLEQGQQEKAVVSRSTRKQQARIMMIGAPILVALTLGLALPMSGDAFTRLSRQNRIDKEGLPTRGVVTGRRAQREGKSGTGYYLAFKFQVAGKTYERESPVDASDYENIPDGSPTRVSYVPSDPTISRMTASIGRRKAIGQMLGTALYALLAIPAGISMFFKGWKMLRAENAAGGPKQ